MALDDTSRHFQGYFVLGSLFYAGPGYTAKTSQGRPSPFRCLAIRSVVELFAVSGLHSLKTNRKPLEVMLGAHLLRGEIVAGIWKSEDKPPMSDVVPGESRFILSR